MNRFKIILLSIVFFSNTLYSQTIEIGSQTWMKRNLDLTTFRNGDPILEARSAEEWLSANQNQRPAWCYYFNESQNGNSFGKLYNIYAIIDKRGLAPVGWRIPSFNDWYALINNLGDSTAGFKMKTRQGWSYNLHYNGNGNDESDFSGLPGGYRFYNGNFLDIGQSSGWWCSTEASSTDAYILILDSSTSEATIGNLNKNVGLYVRCLKD